MDYFEKNGKRVYVTKENRQAIQDELNKCVGGMSITLEGCKPPEGTFGNQEDRQETKKEKSYVFIGGEKVYFSGSDNRDEQEEYTFNGYTYPSKQARDDAEEEYWEEKKKKDEEYYG
ncbi:hypothetical protein [Bacillus sp. S14(2024)]|uniref:hypothetical protein n=1 Tax=Bacillus sp. S14(2024) TaxID=3162884 RepID=UPI003D1F4FBB